MNPVYRLAFFAAISLLTSAIATSAACADDTPAPATSAPTPERVNGCLRAYEDILPGDYYACEAMFYLQNQSYSHSVEELREASYWANKNAQHALGLAYLQGDLPDIPANRPLGLAWLALAAERKNPTYVHDYEFARQYLSPAENAQAEKLLKQMIPVYGDKVAGLRAVRRFNRDIKDIDEASRSGGMVWMSGYGPGQMNASTLSHQLHTKAEQDFEGWQGVVTVGNVERLAPEPASAASAGGP